MMLKECGDNENLKEYALNIQSASQSLLSIVNDILDISKIESGKLEIIPDEYNLFSVLNDCYNMIFTRATNKGLEFIEAMHLFDVTPDDIEVVVHPQSVIHSMVELVDGTVIAQLGVPDMGLPIQLALTYPERKPSMFQRLDFSTLRDLTFEAPDFEKTPCLKLAMDCARTGGTAPCVMSAANEVAVGLFLKHKLGYNRIYDLSAAAVEKVGVVQNPDLDTILAADAAARAFVRETTGE